VVLPLRDKLKSVLGDIAKEFSEETIFVGAGNQRVISNEREFLSLDELLHVNEFRINLTLRGFKPAGLKAFDVWSQIDIKLDPYKYSIAIFRHRPDNPDIEKLYHELPNASEISDFVDRILEVVYDDITQRLEQIKKEKK
jgi:hypothetical protein